MSLSLATLWRRERAAGLRRLSGTRISGVVPIRDRLIEWLIATRRLPAALEDLRVRLHAGNHLTVVAGVRVFGFRKRLELTLRLAPAIETSPPRRLHLFFVDRSLLASAMSLAGPFLPDWVRRHDGGLALDLDRLAAAGGVEDLLPHATAVAFEGHEGVLWVNFEIDVASQDGAARKASLPQSGPARAESGRGLPVADLAPLMAGARLAIRVRAEESLVNEALEGAATSRDGAGRTAGDALPDWRSMVELSSPPRVVFEPGAVVLDVTLRSPEPGTAA